MSQPIEHSQGPWSCSNTAIYDFKGLAIALVSGWQGAERKWDANSKLMAAAPEMYRILCQICHPDWECREQGLRSAQYMLRELEGRSDVES